MYMNIDDICSVLLGFWVLGCRWMAGRNLITLFSLFESESE